MNSHFPGSGRWNRIKRRGLFPAILFIGGVAGVTLLEWRKQRLGFGKKIQDGWFWSDSSIFEFQKIELRLKPDSFYMVHRFINPEDLKARLPCAQADYQTYAAGKYEVQPEGVLRLNGEYTDARFSRDTLRLCRDTGFRALTHLSWKGAKLCLGGATFERTVCFDRSEGAATPPNKK